MEILWNAGADILLIETQPSLQEALIEAEIAEEMGAVTGLAFPARTGIIFMRATPLRNVQGCFPRTIPD